jgi:hypothetical protein
LHPDSDELESRPRRLMQSSKQHYGVQLCALSSIHLLGLVLCINVTISRYVRSQLN